MVTDINSEDRLVQATFAEYLEEKLGWESIFAWNQETFGLCGTLGRTDTREVVLTHDLRKALHRLNPHLPSDAIQDAVGQLTQHDFSRSLLQHNRDFYRLIRDGVPVSYRNTQGQLHSERARVIDFQNLTVNDVPNNRFLAVRELKITGLRSPAYNLRADLVCFINGLPRSSSSSRLFTRTFAPASMATCATISMSTSSPTLSTTTHS
jgi:type I restriction enzyme R subunit